ncbi:MAG: hypothetical protein Q7S52_04915 [bacterium]|nr:hypothetical protein [bacterium]
MGNKRESNNNQLDLAQTEEISAEKMERRREAEAIAEAGSYERILEEFAKVPGLLEEMTDDLKRREAFLIHDAPYLSESDWRILTCLELFDRATFEHCERTWGLAREKLEGDPPVALFHELLAKEGVSVESVLRACLLHDCGKMCLDKQILNDAHTDGEWKIANERFCERMYGPDDRERKVAELGAYLGEHPAHRAIHQVPYKALADLNEKGRRAVEELQTKGVDVSLPLADIIATHQKHSGEILAIENASDSAVVLVENHHPGGPVLAERYPAAISIVRTGVTLSTEMSFAIDMLRLSDIYDAYRSARVYKPGHPNFAALEYLLCEADRGVIAKSVAEAWVKDSVGDLDKEEYFSYFTEYVERAEIESSRSESELLALQQQFEEEQVAHEKLCNRGIIESASCIVKK